MDQPLAINSNLRFEFTQTDFMYLAQTNGNKDWHSGGIVPFQELHISPAAAVFSYGQAVFEGMKAFRTPANDIVLFRPEMNALRFQRSSQRLLMPSFPPEQFVSAVIQTVHANRRWVPPFDVSIGLNAPCSMYIRPVMIGSGAVLGVRPAPAYTFYVFVSPVGPYLPGQGRVIVLDDFHRIPSGGTGSVKAAGNYAGTLLPHQAAVDGGYKDALYLDAAGHQYIEELGSSNFFAVFPGNKLVTPPLAGTILPGVTRDSIIHIARHEFDCVVEERPLPIGEVLENASEAFFTGTAAVVQPITEIHYQGENCPIGNSAEGEWTRRLRQQLVGIQTGQLPDKWRWLHKVV